jgi:hypothetical protein
MVIFNGIPAVSRNRKLSEFPGTKIEANSRNTVPYHYVEKKTTPFKNSIRKDDF